MKVTNAQELTARIKQLREAQKKFATYTQEQVDEIFRQAALAANHNRIKLAKLAVEETGMGIVEDKVVKNNFAAEYIYNQYKNMKTCGVLEEDKTSGITKVAEPIGVISAIVPTTNPTSTAIFKCLIALKTRNAIIISPHPRAKNATIEAARIVLEAAVKAGAPEGIIGWIDQPSVELSQNVMRESDIILATGGPAMVKAAYSSGRPALGVGAGNTPAIIDESAHIKMAVNSILLSKTFDNGMICATEQTVIADKTVYNDVKKEFIKRGCYFLNDEEADKIRKTMLINGALNAKIVGQRPVTIAKMAGFEVPEDTKVLIGEATSTAPEEAFGHEKLTTILGMYKSKNFDDALDIAEALLVNNGGLGHTSVLWVDNINEREKLNKFAARMKTCRLIVNTPSSLGGIGDLYNFDFAPSLTLGCGSWGGNSVSENVGVKHLLNIKTVVERRENMLWFRAPEKVYFKKGCLPVALDELKTVMGKKKAFIVTDQFLYKNGYTKAITDKLDEMGILHETFFDVAPDPTLACALEGVAQLRAFEPDTIIAIGGGSAMDAGKIMWVLYEHPDADFFDMAMRYIDIRKRVYTFPKMGEKAYFIAIPTSSGTGSEVTPFAVITDKKENKKYPLTDYALTPTIAIVDPEFVMSLPGAIAADTGIDVLTHAVEAYVSILASDFTDGWAKQAVKLVFEYLEESVKKGTPIAREKMHNAATIAGMAFANAFLGMNHSLAHKIGGEWHIPHGRTNGILLPHVIRYNGTIPTKLNIWPKIENYKADVKFMELAQLIGLNPKTPAEGVEMFADACEELCHKVGVASNVESQGISREAWEESVHRIAMNAYEDQCTPANPRMPMVKDMEDILRKIYDYKNKFDK